MTTPVSIYAPIFTTIKQGGLAQVVAYGTVAGGMIANPATPADQGLPQVEALFVDSVNPAAAEQTATTFAIQPGQTYAIPAGQTTNLTVNAASTGHKFSGIIFQPPTPFPPPPQPGSFPPAGPVTVIKTIPSYLYVQYNDDADLQAFVDAYNTLAQEYVDWFNSVNLPVYTQIAGSLLDWVAHGLYGMVRPSLSSGLNLDKGPFNTYALNTLGYNERKNAGPQNVTVTSDDVFKRVMTWNFYKGDGNVINVRWLKRRIMRFMVGANGSAPNIDETYAISVSFGAGGVVSIRLAVGSRIILGGALYNRSGFNSTAFNSLMTRFVPGPNPLPNQQVLKEAIESGVLQLPFQYAFSVAI